MQGGGYYNNNSTLQEMASQAPWYPLIMSTDINSHLNELMFSADASITLADCGSSKVQNSYVSWCTQEKDSPWWYLDTMCS